MKRSPCTARAAAEVEETGGMACSSRAVRASCRKKARRHAPRRRRWPAATIGGCAGGAPPPLRCSSAPQGPSPPAARASRGSRTCSSRGTLRRGTARAARARAPAAAAAAGAKRAPTRARRRVPARTGRCACAFRQRRADVHRRHLGHVHRVLGADVRRRRVHGHVRAGADQSGPLRQLRHEHADLQRDGRLDGRELHRRGCVRARKPGADVLTTNTYAHAAVHRRVHLGCMLLSLQRPACTPAPGHAVLGSRRGDLRSAAGSGGPGIACASGTCVNGQCQGTCTAGQTQCSGNGVQSCVSGSWGTATPCGNKTCVGGACVGSCAPGQTNQR